MGTISLAGCATSPTTPSAQAGEGVVRGEVWTWDERAGTVTLRQGGQTVRVKVTPDQFRGLRMHEIVTLRGQLDGPAEIERIVVATPATVPVPRGRADQVEVTGTVRSVDPNGLLSIDSAEGPVTVWTATSDPTRFPAGEPARVRIVVQPVELVPATQPTSAPDPAASVSSEPGDYALVTGRILSVDSGGTLTIESPRGPVVVRVPDGSRYSPGGSVEVRTFVHVGQ